MAVSLLCSSTARFCNGGVTVFIVSIMFVCSFSTKEAGNCGVAQVL